MAKQKLAVFDIDGTLFRWQLYHELVFELKEQGFFGERESQALDDALLSWQAKHVSWYDYEQLVVATIEKHIAKIPPTILEETAQMVVERSGHKVYGYTLRLLQSLQKQGYYTLAISASQQEIAEQFAKKYNFDECIGAVYERSNNTYTGSMQRAIYGIKDQLIRSVLESNPNVTIKESVAIGDSGGDIKMLEMVDHPIAFNPSDDLFKVASKNNWHIVIERKNIAYTLEARHGNTVLAKTDIY